MLLHKKWKVVKIVSTFSNTWKYAGKYKIHKFDVLEKGSYVKNMDLRT